MQLADITAATGFEVLEHLAADADVPVLAALQAQGDLLFVPQPETERIPDGLPVAGGAIPAAGLAVISPVGAGHEHRLFASSPGTAWWTEHLAGGQVLGYLQCTEPVYSLHAEHGATALAAGTWELRRQREQAEEESRLVAD